MDDQRKRTYLTPEFGRPTRESISSELGFTVPTRFADFVGQIFDFAKGDEHECRHILDGALGIGADGIECRYAATPPEFFPIGRTGCDGDHYGFLLHAPELALDELPLGNYCPMDSDGVVMHGVTTEQGIAENIARVLSYDFIEEERKARIREFASYCQITPLRSESPKSVIPNGWKYLPSGDGIGSLGPVEWFSDEPIFDVSKWTMPEEYIWAADVFIKQSQFGTALHYLREGLWRYCWDGRTAIGERTCDLYRKMNRPQLAEVLEWTMANRWTKPK
jgi:hypothetical protein